MNSSSSWYFVILTLTLYVFIHSFQINKFFKSPIKDFYNSSAGGWSVKAPNNLRILISESHSCFSHSYVLVQQCAQNYMNYHCLFLKFFLLLNNPPIHTIIKWFNLFIKQLVLHSRSSLWIPIGNAVTSFPLNLGNYFPCLSLFTNSSRPSGSFGWYHMHLQKLADDVATTITKAVTNEARFVRNRFILITFHSFLSSICAMCY